MQGMPQNPFQVLQMYQKMVPQIKQNPIQFLAQRKFNIPQSCAGDPEKIIGHLVQSGQVSQEAYNSARQMMQQFR